MSTATITAEVATLRTQVTALAGLVRSMVLAQNSMPGAPAMRLIQSHVAENFGLHASVMRSRARPEHIVLPRQLAMYFAHTLTKMSVSDIGRAFARDSGTTFYAMRMVQNRIETEPKFAALVERLETELKAMLGADPMRREDDDQ